MAATSPISKDRLVSRIEALTVEQMVKTDPTDLLRGLLGPSLLGSGLVDRFTRGRQDWWVIYQEAKGLRLGYFRNWSSAQQKFETDTSFDCRWLLQEALLAGYGRDSYLVRDLVMLAEAVVERPEFGGLNEGGVVWRVDWTTGYLLRAVFEVAEDTGEIGVEALQTLLALQHPAVMRDYQEWTERVALVAIVRDLLTGHAWASSTSFLGVVTSMSARLQAARRRDPGLDVAAFVETSAIEARRTAAPGGVWKALPAESALTGVRHEGS